MIRNAISLDEIYGLFAPQDDASICSKSSHKHSLTQSIYASFGCKTYCSFAIERQLQENALDMMVKGCCLPMMGLEGLASSNMLKISSIYVRMEKILRSRHLCGGGSSWLLLLLLWWCNGKRKNAYYLYSIIHDRFAGLGK